MKKLLFVFPLLLILNSPSLAAWSDVKINKSQNITVNGIMYSMIVNTTITKSVAKEVLKTGLKTGVRFTGGEVGLILAALTGSYYLYTEIGPILDDLKADKPNIIESQTYTLNNPAPGGGVLAHFGTSTTKAYASFSSPWTVRNDYILTINNNGVRNYVTITNSSTPHYINYPAGSGYWPKGGWTYTNINGTVINNTEPGILGLAIPHIVSVVNNTGSTFTNTSEATVNDALLEEYLNDSANTELWDNINASIKAASNMPALYIPTAKVQGTLIQPNQDNGSEPATDPATDTDQETTFDPTSTETQTLESPGQPVVPTFDTTITTPEKKDIGGQISTFLNNAPFMAWARSIHVTGSGEQSSFNIAIPAPLGGQNVTLDWSRYSDLWSIISAIVIGIAYIYSAMIILGGKV